MASMKWFLDGVPTRYPVTAFVSGAVLSWAAWHTPWRPFHSYNNQPAEDFAQGLIGLWTVALALAPMLAIRWALASALIVACPLVLGVGAEHEWPFVVYVGLVIVGIIGCWHRPRISAAIVLSALLPVVTVALDRSQMIVPFGAAIGFARGSFDAGLLLSYSVVTAFCVGVALVIRRSASKAMRASESSPTEGDGVDGDSATPRVSGLSPREHEVLLHLATGRTNAEIAGALSVGIETVKSHVWEVLRKLELRDRTQAVVYAYENGLVARARDSTGTPR